MSTHGAAAAAQRPGRGTWIGRFRAWLGGSYAPYIFLLSWFLAFAAFMAYPIGYALWLSFYSWRGVGPPEPVGLENYVYVLTDVSTFWLSIGNSAYLWAAIVPAQTFGGLILAVVVNGARLRGRGLFRTTFFLPGVISLVVIGVVARIMFERSNGVVNAFLEAVGISPIGWLEDTDWSKPTFALISLWRYTGYTMVLMLAGLQNISIELYEAARVDGAGTVRSFVHITVPLMRRIILFCLIIGTIGCFQMFAEPYLITQGGPQNSSLTAGLYLFNQMGNARLGRASATTFLLLAVMLAVSLLMLRVGRDTSEAKS
ncbi:MAG: sugar ABC transporter permease [Chloroflexi bacterium]|nr:sugar ABC transporter permease [Chloroflexota bacterium]